MRSNTFIVKQMVKTVDGENRKLQIRRSQNTVEWWTDRQTDRLHKIMRCVVLSIIILGNRVTKKKQSEKTDTKWQKNRQNGKKDRRTDRPKKRRIGRQISNCVR